MLAAPQLGLGEPVTAGVAMLARVGAPVSADGIAAFACDLLEDSSWDPRRDRLLMSTSPWVALEEWVGDEAILVHRRAKRVRKKDAAALAGIEEASSRPELE